MRLSVGLTTIAITVVGCAARGPSPALVAEVGKADVVMSAGCYRCLEEALQIFERLASDPRGPQRARRGAFEAAVLLAVRSKELGLPFETFLMRARAHAAALPTSPPPAIPPTAYIEAAEFFTGDLSGLDPEVRQLRARRPRARDDRAPAPVRAALDAAPPDDLVASYLALSIDCEDIVTRTAAAKLDEISARYRNSSLMRFKEANCRGNVALFESLRTENPRWVDTLVFEGRREMSRGPATVDVSKASGLFSRAHEEFPDSPAITLSYANALNALGEYQPALELYDNVLATEPTHRDALHGRLLSLSYLERHADAIGVATRMIELGTWHIGDAYYWRAWNRYNLQELDTAWADVEDATKLLVNSSVYTLAGFVAFARKELDTAIQRFERAYSLDRTNCEAVWTGAMVHVEQQTWPQAATKFVTSVGCFASTAAEARADIVRTQAATYAETIKTRRIEAAQKRVESAEHRRAQAAFNAAQSFVRLGQKADALAQLEIAAEHHLMSEKAASLKASIEKMP